MGNNLQKSQNLWASRRSDQTKLWKPATTAVLVGLGAVLSLMAWRAAAPEPLRWDTPVATTQNFRAALAAGDLVAVAETLTVQDRTSLGKLPALGITTDVLGLGSGAPLTTATGVTYAARYLSDDVAIVRPSTQGRTNDVGTEGFGRLAATEKLYGPEPLAAVADRLTNGDVVLVKQGNAWRVDLAKTTQGWLGLTVNGDPNPQSTGPGASSPKEAATLWLKAVGSADYKTMADLLDPAETRLTDIQKTELAELYADPDRPAVQFTPMGSATVVAPGVEGLRTVTFSAWESSTSTDTADLEISVTNEDNEVCAEIVASRVGQQPQDEQWCAPMVDAAEANYLNSLKASVVVVERGGSWYVTPTGTLSAHTARLYTDWGLPPFTSDAELLFWLRLLEAPIWPDLAPVWGAALAVGDGSQFNLAE